MIKLMKKSNKSLPSIIAVDVFCGVGGLTHGLRKAGIEVTAGYDIDSACEWPFEKNNGKAKFHKVDVAELKSEVLKAHFGNDENGISLLAGCAPCQPFSTYSLNKTDEADNRWLMLEHFGRLVKEIRPTLVTMENVPQVRKHKVFQRFVEELKDCGYSTTINIVKCEEYGIPQSRIRLVLLASLLGKVELRPKDPRRDKRRTVRHAIGKLEKLTAGGVSEVDSIHRTSMLSEMNFKRMLVATPGGSWRDWDQDLVAPCHQEETGKTFPGVYGRMEWDKPSPTITTQFFGFGSGRFGHPQQNRALSLREGAILQTFPPSYKFVKKNDTVYIKTVGRLIGNAVPVRLGQIIGESLTEHISAMAKAR